MTPTTVGRHSGCLKRSDREDHRVEVFKPREHSGVIGQVKNWACSLASGQILVEMDHDDELTDRALEWVVKGFGQFPEAGFLYTDCAEVYADGRNLTYRDGWAFGYGSYRDVEYRGRLYKAGSAGNINSKTIRHIVSAPNHIRAWRRAFYEAIGGHNKGLHAADDYEIIVRTFLETRMVRVPRLCYIQRIGDSAQRTRSMDIHRHVRSIRSHYDGMIHKRFLQLGCEDFAWDEKNGCSDATHSQPGPGASRDPDGRHLTGGGRDYHGAVPSPLREGIQGWGKCPPEINSNNALFLPAPYLHQHHWIISATRPVQPV